MSEWHREYPELAGTDADPWCRHKSYRQAQSYVKALSGAYCRVCEAFLESQERGVCDGCKESS